MDRTNNRIGSIRFDDETILEVSQKGGGGAGVGGTGGLEARNLVTGESTNEAIEDLTEDLEDAQETIETQAQTIEDLTDDLQEANDTIAEKQAIIDAFPTIEALNVTNNGTYSETGKAYSPVNVNVAGGFTVNQNAITLNVKNSTSSTLIHATVNIVPATGELILTVDENGIASGGTGTIMQRLLIDNNNIGRARFSWLPVGTISHAALQQPITGVTLTESTNGFSIAVDFTTYDNTYIIVIVT